MHTAMTEPAPPYIDGGFNLARKCHGMMVLGGSNIKDDNELRIKLFSGWWFVFVVVTISQLSFFHYFVIKLNFSTLYYGEFLFYFLFRFSFDFHSVESFSQIKEIYWKLLRRKSSQFTNSFRLRKWGWIT